MYVQPNFVPAPPTPAPKPWEDSSDDSDMEPPKTKKKLKSEASSLGKKRGRPTKKSLEDKKREEFLASLPQLPEGEDQMLGYKKKGVCKACQLYKGLVALKPCGHAKICISCVRDVRESAEKMFRHSKCPVTGCFAQITDWLPLFNVSA
ncbi:uncharacterized protein LOC127751060 [Frankliniella occidentalis]|nr:uncharacterized protein LOC127751060 [Frankliniella occidentalis]